jgi:hypothetical protein
MRTLLLVSFATVALAQEPLVIGSQGSFFVGGETKQTSAQGSVTVNQMYVQFQKPADAAGHLPVVMIHGCCLSSKTWETTPDGRMGWNEYFLRRNRPVYLADQVSRARSGFDASKFMAVRAGTMKPNELPNIFQATHQTAWTIFRFGPRYGETYADGQFPVEAVTELYKQMIPDLNGVLPSPNPTWTNLAALAVQLNGAVLMGHSESGFFPEEAALIDPSGVRGIISIEQPCRGDYKPEQLATLARIPILVMFGDHLDGGQGGPVSWQASYQGCQTFVKQVNDAGGRATMMYLPEMGIKGNSHMLMQDRNNLALADLILNWIDTKVEAK